MRSVSGRILAPSPAAKTMALAGRKEDIGVPVAKLSYDDRMERSKVPLANFRFCNAHQMRRGLSTAIAALKLAREAKGPWQMLLIPEVELG
jgi:hypothetical protein